MSPNSFNRSETTRSERKEIDWFVEYRDTDIVNLRAGERNQNVTSRLISPTNLESDCTRFPEIC